MSIELKIPSAGESITEVVIVEWLKDEGASVELDETVAIIETDKANVDVVAPQAGRLGKILKQAGASAEVGEVIGYLEPGEGAAQAKPAPAPAAAVQAEAAPKNGAPEPSRPAAPESRQSPPPRPSSGGGRRRAAPSVRRAMRSENVNPDSVDGTGPAGAITMNDVQAKSEAPRRAPAPPRSAPTPVSRVDEAGRATETVAMTPLRRRVAERLVSAQREAALLTTFNEVDMGPVMALRKSYKERFIDRHGVKLGFMSFFVKAAIEGLKAFPGVNARIEGQDIVYHDYYDIGVAVGGGRGLVVPVLRSAERMSFADVEKTIGDFAVRAKKNRLKVDELQGGTFTISNGGIYGSLLSTPIVNPPQSGILGMHAIQDRPVVRDGQVVVAKMMYVALTYDHRIVDGREAVSFLVRVKECIENPSRILLEV